MICNVVRFLTEQGERWGVVVDGSVLELKNCYKSTKDFIESGRSEAYSLLQNPGTAVKKHNYRGLDLLSPITRPCKVLCQGANYRQHMIDSGMNPDSKKFNMIFNKSCASISAPNTDIVRPQKVKLLDYEVELTLVLGKEVTESVVVGEHNLHEYVAGICIGNDVSARDIQIPQMQFFKGKSYRTFCPLGPILCLLEKEDMSYLDEMKLALSVNGEVRQCDYTSELVYRPAQTLTELSEISDFSPGDVVMTGTPSGCALGIPSPLLVKVAALLPEAKKWSLFIKGQSKRAQYLKHGDQVRTTIVSRDGKVNLGEQVNRVVSA